MKHLILFPIIGIFLTACGGGGSGGSSSGNPTTFGVAVKSTHADAVDSLRRAIVTDETFSASLSDEQKRVFSQLSTDALIAHYPNGFSATRDTQAEEAWRMGWTGKGVKVSIADSFNSDFGDDVAPFGGETIYASHGKQVHLIAQQVAPEATYDLGTVALGGTQQEFMASLISFARNRARNGWHIINNSASISRVQENEVEDRYVRVSEAAWRAQINELKNISGFLDFVRPSNQDGAIEPRMLFVTVSGNDGEAQPPNNPTDPMDDDCTSGLENCNLLAATIHQLRKQDGMDNAGDRILFVGALTQGTETIAPYSITAGAMVDDFIVAEEALFDMNDTENSGTSFAAPRVAGAAALVRHKFPNLNGPQLKQVLLHSADDLGVEGPDEIYGHGKLNVISALSPIDGLTR